MREISQNIGYFSAVMAEIFDVMIAIKTTKQKGCRSLCKETGSQNVVLAYKKSKLEHLY